MKRRDFIAFVGGVAAWPLAANAQQQPKLRRVGVLMSTAESDAESQARMGAFLQGLKELGWTLERDLRVDIRWSPGDTNLYRSYAAELAALTPDVLVATNTSTVQALRQAAGNLPIVFASSVDPVGSGLVRSLAQPGGNITGFATRDFSMSAKWLELLREVLPGLSRVAVLRDTTTTGGIAQFGAIQAIASLYKVDLVAVDARDPRGIERDLAELGNAPNTGLIATSTAATSRFRSLVTTLALRHRLPGIYPDRASVAAGGLIFYGPDPVDQYRRAAGYVDRVLKGERPADLPVQMPTKYALIVNLKTAKAIGLTVPDAILARADEVIE
jgi:putative ABC transport system substrate-binding protein